MNFAIELLAFELKRLENLNSKPAVSLALVELKEARTRHINELKFALKTLKTTLSTECIKSDVGQSFGRCIDFEIDDESGACHSQCDFCKKLPQ